MKHLVRLLISQHDIRRTPSIYISILLAYLEMKDWNQAQGIIHIMETLEMRPEEKEAYLYLKQIIYGHDEAELEDLWNYLNC